MRQRPNALVDGKAAALRAVAARAHRDVPASHRPAPPPWPVHLRYGQDAGHKDLHACTYRGHVTSRR